MLCACVRACVLAYLSVCLCFALSAFKSVYQNFGEICSHSYNIRDHLSIVLLNSLPTLTTVPIQIVQSCRASMAALLDLGLCNWWNVLTELQKHELYAEKLSCIVFFCDCK